MEHFTYFFILFLIFAVPFVASLALINYHQLYRQWKALVLSLSLVSFIFIIWDMIVTARGHWRFNPLKVTDLSFFNLPLEEVLFFFTTGFSMLFVYELVKKLPHATKSYQLQPIRLALATMMLLVAIINLSREYTALVFFLSATLLLYKYFKNDPVTNSKGYLIYLSLGFLLFFIFNFLLTSIPVVLYGQIHMTNIRVLTIPLEDFIYNYILLTAFVLIYEKFKK